MYEHRTIPGIFLTITLTLSLAACNFTFGQPPAPATATSTQALSAAQPTASPTTTPLSFTETPTSPGFAGTSVPPTDTPTTLPPTVTLAPTATSAPVTATTPVTTAISPTATVPPTRVVVTTPEPVRPAPKAKFEGTFLYGTLVLRTTTNGNMIIPKSVTLRNAPCRVGHNSVTFEPPPAFDIIDGKFTISTENLLTGDTVVITGQFFSSTSVQGTIKLTLKGSGTCTIGPLSWKGTMTEQDL